VQRPNGIVEASSLVSGAPVSAPPIFRAAPSARVGVIAGLCAYLAWGFIALFFKLLTHVPPVVVLSHRIVWSAVFVAGVLTVQGRWADVAATFRSRRGMAVLAGSTVMIAVNWYTFLWAVTNQQVVQAGLGYFINPLVSVLLGMAFLRERLRSGQAAALLLAAAGVAVQVVALGHVPWVALSLAVSFGFYALLRKTAPAGPLVGLFVETILLVPLALFFVISASRAGAAPFTRGTYAILMSAGVVTAVPLLLFATAARRLRLATMGFLQFISPTCQLLLAVLAFHEPFTRWHAISFALIWAGLVLYSLDSLRAYQSAPRENPAPIPGRHHVCSEV
jgi:chloramphenicol-sensitive protein RarD